MEHPRGVGGPPPPSAPRLAHSHAVALFRQVDLNVLVKQVGLKYGLSRVPKLVEIIAALPDEHRSELLPQLRAKPVRTASGVAIVALMSMPHRCPHISTTGNICVYCPGGGYSTSTSAMASADVWRLDHSATRHSLTHSLTRSLTRPHPLVLICSLSFARPGFGL